MLDGVVTDLIESKSLSFAKNHIDIYSSSWGPDDNGETVDGPGELTQAALVQGSIVVGAFVCFPLVAFRSKGQTGSKSFFGDLGNFFSGFCDSFCFLFFLIFYEKRGRSIVFSHE